MIGPLAFSACIPGQTGDLRAGYGRIAHRPVPDRRHSLRHRLSERGTW